MRASEMSTSVGNKHLRIHDLWSGYGRTAVLQGVTLDVLDGEVVALLGRNGVGKSTLLKTIMGGLRPRAGTIRLGDEAIDQLASHEIARRGIAYIPQGRGIFPRLTVEENLLLGMKGRRDGLRVIPEHVFGYFPILRERLGQLGGTLSGGQQQMLAIARALVADPKLILLDEPSEGIQPNIVDRIGDVIRQINRDHGVSMLLVEQNLDLALSVAHRCLIMEKGQIVYAGTPQELQTGDLIQRFLVI